MSRPLAPWRRIGAERLQDCRVFDVERVRFEPPHGGPPEAFFRIEAPHWVNVVPLDANDEVLCVRQYRFGVEDFTLEVPGGMCDPGESPETAARRELLEETGCSSAELELLGWVHPNPALQSNRCYSFLARDPRQVGAPAGDPHEEIELVRVPLADVDRRIAAGEITHALVVTAFQLLATYRAKR